MQRLKAVVCVYVFCRTAGFVGRWWLTVYQVLLIKHIYGQTGNDGPTAKNVQKVIPNKHSKLQANKQQRST